jgi:acyl-CoA thioesterase I
MGEMIRHLPAGPLALLTHGPLGNVSSRARLEVSMPRGIALAAYALLAVFFATPAAAQVVALGASNTEGYGVGGGQAYPSQLERMLRARGISVSVRNAGVSGNTTAQMLARLDSAIPTGTRLVLFHPGGNDWLRGVRPEERQRNVAAINQELQARGIRVINVTAAFQSARSGNLQGDGIHLTARGHERFAQGLVDDVANAMKK